MTRITYAVAPDGLVVSRVENQLAWPILNYAAYAKTSAASGDFRGPFTYSLAKVPVFDVGREWDSLRWTKKIPVAMKNLHREFWGFKPLKEKST